KNTLKHLQTHPVGKMILTPSNSLLGSSQYQYQTPNQETAQTQSMYQADTFNSGHSYYQQYYPGYYNPADSLYYPNPSSLLLPNQLYSLSASSSSLSSNNSCQLPFDHHMDFRIKKRVTDEDADPSPVSSSVSSPNSDSTKKSRQSRISVHKKQKLEKLEMEEVDDEEFDELNESHNDGVHEPKKRVTANKKERRRTQSINNAFEDLRKRIPEIPFDTKLSKIKTLKLAIGYIEHLMKLLQENDPSSLGPFKPDLGKLRRECRSKEIKLEVERKSKGRTGWPADVWSSEMKKKINDSTSNKKMTTDCTSMNSYASHMFANYAYVNKNNPFYGNFKSENDV
ncbi:putative heart- and neural crest derivatives-expressed protein 2-like isoform X2, partial [Brachionus plicatilis]